MWSNQKNVVLNKIAIAVVVSLLAGFAVGAWIVGEEPATTEPLVQTVAGIPGNEAGSLERLQGLEQIIAEERDARIALEDTIAMLFEELERIEGAGDQAAAARRQAEREQERAARSTERGRPGTVEWVRNYQERRVTRLVEGGFSEDEARRILQQESEASFKAMKVTWEAQRNGENIDFPGLSNSPQSILRAEIGDDAYARYLEVQGQPTAVRVTQVLSGSPGTAAGLQPGDQLVSYDGRRLFDVGDLRRQTMQGEPGQDVVIEVVRDGVRMQLTVPRGPIGITGSGANIRNTNWWGS